MDFCLDGVPSSGCPPKNLGDADGVGQPHIQAAEEIIWAYDLDFHFVFWYEFFSKKNKNKNDWVPKKVHQKF